MTPFYAGPSRPRLTLGRRLDRAGELHELHDAPSEQHRAVQHRDRQLLGPRHGRHRGNTLTYRDNIVDSTYLAGMMVATEPINNNQYISYPINGLKFQRNTINLASHTGMNHAGLHFWLGTNPMSNVHIDLNVISNGLTNGIRIENSSYGDDGHTLFDFNTAQNNATDNYTNASTHIAPTLNQNVGF